MTTMRSMDGRVVCVAGASRGIGRAIGANVHLAGRTEGPMEESAAKIAATGGNVAVAWA